MKPELLTPDELAGFSPAPILADGFRARLEGPRLGHESTVLVLDEHDHVAARLSRFHWDSLERAFFHPSEQAGDLMKALAEAMSSTTPRELRKAERLCLEAAPRPTPANRHERRAEAARQRRKS